MAVSVLLDLGKPLRCAATTLPPSLMDVKKGALVEGSTTREAEL